MPPGDQLGLAVSLGPGVVDQEGTNQQVDTSLVTQNLGESNYLKTINMVQMKKSKRIIARISCSEGVAP